jgi:hypothetical protein
MPQEAQTMQEPVEAAVASPEEPEAEQEQQANPEETADSVAAVASPEEQRAQQEHPTD